MECRIDHSKRHVRDHARDPDERGVTDKCVGDGLEVLPFEDDVILEEANDSPLRERRTDGLGMDQPLDRGVVHPPEIDRSANDTSQAIQLRFRGRLIRLVDDEDFLGHPMLKRD
jgi:hypothetical protein